MARLARWFALLVAPLLLTSCLLVPAKFASSLDIRADRSFTFTYVGEVQLLKSSKTNPLSEETAPGNEENGDEESGGEATLWKIAEQKGGAPKTDGSFEDSADDATQLQRLAQTLSSEYGFRSARYIGNRKLAIDYRVSGTLDHAFVFPFNPDGEVILPFIAIELRGKDRVRVKAPGFANDASAAPMGGIGGLPGEDGPGSVLDGVFTLTTNAEIISQNQEDGGQDLPDGGKKFVWTVNPTTRDAPMAVLKVKALP